MDKLKNLSIGISIKDKKGKLVKDLIIKNTLLVNRFDFAIWSRLPNTIGNVLYPKFSNHVDQPGVYPNGIEATEVCYVNATYTNSFNPQTTSMNFDIFGGSARTPQIVSNEKAITVSKYTIQTVTAAMDGLPLKEIGFGLSLLDGVTDFLMAYVDVSALNLIVFEDWEIIVTREDSAICEYPYDQFIGPRSLLSAVDTLEKVSFFDQDDILRQEKLVGDLTLSATSDDNSSTLIMSGFEPFRYSTEDYRVFPSQPLPSPFFIILPSTNTYPGPAYGIEMYEYCEIQYQNTSFTPSKYIIRIPIKELNFTFNDGVIQIEYKIERGQ